MDELDTIKTVGQWLSGVGATGVLLFVIWRLETGKWLTQKHHEEVVDELNRALTRALTVVDKLTESRTQDNAVLEKFAEKISDMHNTVDLLRSTIENMRSRR